MFFNSVSGKYGVSAVSTMEPAPDFFKASAAEQSVSCGINHIVDQNTIMASNFSNHMHRFAFIVLGTTLVDNRQLRGVENA